METLALAKEQDRFSEGSESPKEFWPALRVILSTDMVYFAQKNYKKKNDSDA